MVRVDGLAAAAVPAAAEPGATQPLTVTVAFSPCAGTVDEISLSLPAGSTIEDALRASGLLQRHAALGLAHAPVGVWGVLRGPHERLRDADRVEIYRALTVDPKEARRRRQRDAVKRG